MNSADFGQVQMHEVEYLNNQEQTVEVQNVDVIEVIQERPQPLVDANTCSVCLQTFETERKLLKHRAHMHDAGAYK